MKKKSLKTIMLFSCLSLMPISLLASCGERHVEVVTKEDFVGVKFEDKSVEFDGNYHTISPVNLPKNTTINYVGESSFRDIGTYEITVKLSKENYNNKTLSAKLKITKPTIKNVTMPKSLTVVYDGLDHSKDVKPEGSLKDVTITGPTITKDNEPVNEAINVGNYIIKYKCTKDGHEDLYLKTVLGIKGKSMDLVTLDSYDKKVPYDGLDHIDDINVIKPVNQSATVQRIVLNDSGKKVAEAKEIGKYYFTFLIKQENFETKTLMAQMEIFDAEHLVNQKNKILTVDIKDNNNQKSKELIFYDLHNDAKLTKYNPINGQTEVLVDEKVVDYTISENKIYFKNEAGSLKYGNINDKTYTEFADQKANLDFVTVHHKHLIYTRPGENNTTEICRLTETKNIEVLAAESAIANVVVDQNLVYYLAKVSTLNWTIKSLSILDDMTGIVPKTLDENIKNVSQFKIYNGKIYYDVSLIISHTLYEYPLYGTEKIAKELFSTKGEKIEFVLNKNELIYNISSLTDKSGIFKRYLDSLTDEAILYDSKDKDFSLNSLTLIDENLFFSKQSTMDCHLYTIKSFGESHDIKLVK